MGMGVSGGEEGARNGVILLNGLTYLPKAVSLGVNVNTYRGTGLSSVVLHKQQ